MSVTHGSGMMSPCVVRRCGGVAGIALMTGWLCLASCAKEEHDQGESGRINDATLVTAAAEQENPIDVLLAWSKIGPRARVGPTFGEYVEQLSASDLRFAKRYVESHPDYTSYYLLLAVRRRSASLYAKIANSTKAAVLCSALAHHACANDWGALSATDEQYYGEATKAVVETGTEALQYLKPMLRDTRPAYSWGSSAATDSLAAHYRRCDYAYRLICLILGRKPYFHVDPAKRSRSIRELIAEFNIPAFRTLDVLIAESKAGRMLGDTDVLRVKKWSDQELKLAKGYVEAHPDHTSYLVLLEIRRQSRSVYEKILNSTKAAVLCSALVESQRLNDYGYTTPVGMEAHDGEAAKALVETGQAGLECLRPILENAGEVMPLGGQASAFAGASQYRYCDYAYRYASLILGRSPAFHRDPAVRDEHIGRLIKELRGPQQ